MPLPVDVQFICKLAVNCKMSLKDYISRKGENKIIIICLFT